MLIELAAATAISASALVLPSRAESSTACFISQATSENLDHLQRSKLFNNSKVFSELASVFQECREDNWDGFHALPIQERAYRTAANLIKVMPLGTPLPSVSAEPDGHLTLEWYTSVRQMLSLSISNDGTIHYAALLANKQVYGSEPFVGKVPEIVLQLINKVS